jgi:protein-disulfide isomerase
MRMIHTTLLASALFTSCTGNEGTSGAPPPAVEAPPAAPAPRASRFAVPTDGLPAFGPSDALVTIVEFTDYDCPFCAKAEHTMQTIRDRYGKDVRFAVAMHPLPMHPNARPAALAALEQCSSSSSSFASVHARMFERPDDRPALRGSTDATRLLAHAEALADKLHVRGTPTFFVNGRRIGGAQPLPTFERVIDEELAYARGLTSRGIARERVYSVILEEARANPAPFEEESAEDGPVFVPEAKTAGGAVLAGPANASRTILVFTDFECPYCKRLDGQLRDLAAKENVRVVLRNKPLPMHSHARLAAKAAIAADKQGKLAEMTKELFQHQDALDRASLMIYAERLALDIDRFRVDLDSWETDARLAEDEALATKLNVKGTPTSFVDGKRVIGAQPLARFTE